MNRMLLTFIALWVGTAPLYGNSDPIGVRDYYRDFTEDEVNSITHVVTTLGTHSAFSLLFRQKELYRAGDRAQHVHPLAYLAHMYTDPELKIHARNIDGILWWRFRKQFMVSLEHTWQKDNFTEAIVADFSGRVGLDPAVVAGCLQDRQWKAFFILLQRPEQTRSE